MGTLSRKHILIGGLAALAFVLIGATVGLIVTSSGGGDSGSVRSLTLQPSDLPSELVLGDETLYTREELLAELPAQSQFAEAGLKEAVHLSWEAQGDTPTVIDVFVYAYEDEASAREAHGYLTGQDTAFNYLLRRVDGGDDPRSLEISGGLAEDFGDDAYSMSGEMETEAGTKVAVSMYVMRSGSARAEVLVAGGGTLLDPDKVARAQYLRLRRPEALSAP